MLVRTFLTSLCGSLLALLLPLAAGAADRSAEGGVVVLATHADREGIGAGTVVAKSGTRVRIITAGHVATFGALAVRLADGSVVPARLVAVIAGRDLAVIEADVTASNVAGLAAAPVSQPQAAEAVHVWGSGNDGPAYELGQVGKVGATMPDGAPNGRYAVGCALCHQGDSGAGIFNARGELVGVYIGYFEVERGRVSVAELPAAAARVALAGEANVAATTAKVLSQRGSGRNERVAVTEVADRLAR